MNYLNKENARAPTPGRPAAASQWKMATRHVLKWPPDPGLLGFRITVGRDAGRPASVSGGCGISGSSFTVLPKRTTDDAHSPAVPVSPSSTPYPLNLLAWEGHAKRGGTDHELSLRGKAERRRNDVWRVTQDGCAERPSRGSSGSAKHARMSDDADDDEPYRPLVVDAGRLCWRVGWAGDDAPMQVWEPAEGTTIAERRRRSWSKLREWCAQQDVPQPRRAIFSVNVFDDADGPVVAEIAAECFGLTGQPALDEIVVASQEVLTLFACGRFPPVLVNLGRDISVVGFYGMGVGALIGEMVRRAPNPAAASHPPREADLTAAASQAADLIVDSFLAAPADFSLFSLAHDRIRVVLCGGFARALNEPIKNAVRERVLGRALEKWPLSFDCAPEAPFMAWIGASILGDLPASHCRATFVATNAALRYPRGSIFLSREQWLARRTAPADPARFGAQVVHGAGETASWARLLIRRDDRARRDAADARAALLVSLAAPALRARGLAAPLVERIRGLVAGLCAWPEPGIPAVSGVPVSSEQAERRERRAVLAYAAARADGSDERWIRQQCVAAGASDAQVAAAVASAVERLRACATPAERQPPDDYEIACPAGCGAIMRLSERTAHVVRCSMPDRRLAVLHVPSSCAAPPALPLSASAGTPVYDVERLRAPGPYPDGVNVCSRETYLSDAQFLSEFGVGKVAFAAWPKWKATKKKKDLNLF